MSKKINDVDFHIHSAETDEQRKLSDFDKFKKLPQRQMYEALCSMVAVIQKLELQEVADTYRKTDLSVGAWDLALNTALGNKLIVELEDGSKEDAFHDFWMLCPICDQEFENEDASCISEDGNETWVCSSCGL